MLFAKIFGLERLFYPDVNMYSCDGDNTKTFASSSIGILYFSLGLFYQACYIPCLIVISRPPLSRMSCYKIMFYLGVVDVVCLTVCADMAGIWSLTGQRACGQPLLAYVLGNLSMGCWSATCFCCILLAFNRLVDLMFPKSNVLFEGRKIRFWLIFPTIYFVYFAFFERPLLFDPLYHTFFFDPHSNYSLSLNPNVALTIYANIPHTLNNAVVIVVLVTVYVIICINLLIQARRKKLEHINNVSKQIILQSSIICGCHVVGCFLYVYSQYFWVPEIFTIIANMAWMGNHGLPGVIYLVLNKSIRREVFKLFKSSKKNFQSTISIQIISQRSNP